MKSKRLYIITRRDLRRGLKIAQTCHVALESPKNLPLDSKEIPYVVVLEVEDEERLDRLLELVTKKTDVVKFREPDLDDQLTAIAFLGSNNTRSLTEGLRLAG